MYDSICPPVEQVTHKEQQTSVLVGGDALFKVIGMDASQIFPYKGANVYYVFLDKTLLQELHRKNCVLKKDFFLEFLIKSKFLRHACSADLGIVGLM